MTRPERIHSTRRQFLGQSAIATLVVTGSSVGLAGCDVLSNDGGPAGALTKFSDQQFQLLGRLCDMLIPATDTPGAHAAKVPRFVEGLLSDWASPETAAGLAAALDRLDARATKSDGASFLSLTPSRQVAVLEAHEDEAFADETGDEGYRRLKSLIYHGYYRSEVGCTQELQFKLIPGPDARMDVPLSEVGRTWV